MLKKELNDLVTQTGPGTPMGNLFRRYWLPALLSEQLPGRAIARTTRQATSNDGTNCPWGCQDQFGLPGH